MNKSYPNTQLSSKNLSIEECMNYTTSVQAEPQHRSVTQPISTSTHCPSLSPPALQSPHPEPVPRNDVTTPATVPQSIHRSRSPIRVPQAHTAVRSYSPPSISAPVGILASKPPFRSVGELFEVTGLVNCWRMQYGVYGCGTTYRLSIPRLRAGVRSAWRGRRPSNVGTCPALGCF